jgi:hypothetical protein
LAGRVRSLRGELEPAVRCFEDGLALWWMAELPTSSSGSDPSWPARTPTREWGRRARAARALPGLVGAGEDWRAQAGYVALAKAVVLAGEDRLDEADAAFTRAHDIFGRYRPPGAQAELPLARGRASGDASKLEEAADVLRRDGAGP